MQSSFATPNLRKCYFAICIHLAFYGCDSGNSRTGVGLVDAAVYPFYPGLFTLFTRCKRRAYSSMCLCWAVCVKHWRSLYRLHKTKQVGACVLCYACVLTGQSIDHDWASGLGCHVLWYASVSFAIELTQRLDTLSVTSFFLIILGELTDWMATDHLRLTQMWWYFVDLLAGYWQTGAMGEFFFSISMGGDLS